MNEVNVLLADREDFKFITAVFAPYTGKNTYTYKTLLDVKVDDFVLVDTPSNGYQVVQVREVLSALEVDLEVKFEYKWLIQKVDLEHYDKVIAMEKEVRSVVNKSKNKRAIKQAREAILEHADEEAVKKLVRL